MWLVYVVGGIAFFVAAYAAWQVAVTTDVLVAVKWGLVALFLLQITTVMKVFMGTRMEANRLLREIKRVELQLSLLRGGGGTAR
jgi:hypothetical protein